MKFRKTKNERFDHSNNWRGVKKGYTVGIHQSMSSLSSSYMQIYFMIENKSLGYIFNSLWEFPAYETFEKCCAAAEEYLDNIIEKSIKEINPDVKQWYRVDAIIW